jgi:adenylate cyclase
MGHLGGVRRLGPMLAVALAAAALALAADVTGVFDRLEGDTVDARFELRGKQPVGGVAVVAIDDATFSELRRRWPFARSLHAQVIDRLRRAGARQIAYDVQFTEPSKPSEDLALLQAVARARHAVLSTTEVDSRGRTNVLGGDEQLRQVGARAANTGVSSDAGGVVRRLRYSVEGLESFPVAAVEAATHRRVDRGSLSSGGALIDFHGPPGTVPSLSFSRVLRGRFDPRLVRGRIVVVGASAPSLQDLHPTSTSGGELMAGPEVQANAISTVLRGFPLRKSAWWLDALCVLAMALVAPLATLRLRPLGVAAASVAALAAYAFGAFLAFRAGLVVAVIAPAAALGLASLGALGVRVATEARERRRTRDLFGRFVPEPVVEQLLDSQDAARLLGAKRLEGTVLFCDLRGFTTFAEGHSPERVLQVLNRYLTEMSEAILDHGGTVVSYMGDGIMAVFGTPLPRDDHAQKGFDTAHEMVRVRMPRLNAWLREQGLPAFRLGVGLNSGPVMSGTVGSERRLEYAAIGDTTNVAARLEAMTKETGGGLLLADSTRARLRSGADELVRGGEIEVRGRTETVVVWHLQADPAEAEQPVEAAATP